MTESLDSTTSGDAPNGAAAEKAPRKRAGGLNSMLLADLKAMAGGMGIPGAGSMKKAALVDAIKSAQSGQSGQASPAGDADRPKADRKADRPKADGPKADEPTAEQPNAEPAPAEQPQSERPTVTRRRRSDRNRGDQAPAEQAEADRPRDEQRTSDQPRADVPRAEQPTTDQAKAEHPRTEQSKTEQPQGEQGRADQGDSDAEDGRAKQGGQQSGQGKQGGQGQAKQGGQQSGQQSGQGKQGGQGQPKQGGQQGAKQGGQGKQDQRQDQRQDARQDPRQDQDRGRDEDDDFDGDGEGGEGGSRRNRRRRGRDRDRTTRTTREPDTEVREDDVLVPAAGILDVLDNYAFVRTSGYLPGVDDVYLSLSMVRRYGLRRGDAVTGQVRQPREGERREKFNPMVRIETVNGVDPEQAKNRVEFDSLTPISPADRLRLETGPDGITGRVLDLVAPVGKGQRGLILSPSDAGKTATLQAIANAVTTNNPECHLMVVLVDARPEEVTDFQRAVKGEVVASTFDRPAADHTTMAELAIERAKRLVELGHDVVVLLDGLTRLGRAFNLTAPASGRILPGGVDAAALYPPKRFFGAARNIENGGSLTILATALVDSGSKIDEAILEEFTGTSNLRIRLSSELAEQGLFPAVDVAASTTRRTDLLLGKEEVAILDLLRREVAGKEPAAALEQVLGMVRNSQTNYELLVRLQRSGS